MAPISQRLAALLPSLSTLPNLQVTPFGETNYELAFDLPHSFPRAVDKFNLGKLGGSTVSTLRITREKVYWLMPSIDSELPGHVDTQVLLLRYKYADAKSEGVAVVLPLTTSEYMGTLRGSGSDLVICFESDLIPGQSDRMPGKVVISLETNVKSAIRAAVNGARSCLGSQIQLNDLDKEQHIFSGSLT